MTKALAKRIVAKIFEDLEDRSGFDGWWEDIAPSIKREIRRELVSIIERELAAGGSDAPKLRGTEE